jgi:hypothetical protein
LSEATLPPIGIASSQSHVSRVSRLRPAPSAPTTNANGPKVARQRHCIGAASSPTTQTPDFFKRQRLHQIGDGRDAQVLDRLTMH